MRIVCCQNTYIYICKASIKNLESIRLGKLQRPNRRLGIRPNESSSKGIPHSFREIFINSEPKEEFPIWLPTPTLLPSWRSSFSRGLLSIFGSQQELFRGCPIECSGKKDRQENQVVVQKISGKTLGKLCKTFSQTKKNLTSRVYTPQKFNIDTKNDHIQNEIHFPNHHFGYPC